MQLGEEACCPSHTTCTTPTYSFCQAQRNRVSYIKHVVNVIKTRPGIPFLWLTSSVDLGPAAPSPWVTIFSSAIFRMSVWWLDQLGEPRKGEENFFLPPHRVVEGRTWLWCNLWTWWCCVSASCWPQSSHLNNGNAFSSAENPSVQEFLAGQQQTYDAVCTADLGAQWLGFKILILLLALWTWQSCFSSLLLWNWGGKDVDRMSI